jgi:hypothetical protein
MSWTVACFCGNVYSAPPERCAACGSSIAPMVDDVAVAQGHASVDGSPIFSQRPGSEADRISIEDNKAVVFRRHR